MSNFLLNTVLNGIYDLKHKISNGESYITISYLYSLLFFVAISIISLLALHHTSHRPRIATPIREEPPSITALLIGIDEYISLDFPDLEGAKADAEDVENYLKGELGVDASRIKTLHNKEATHEAIIAQLYALRDNPQIEKGDPILIFYAGHGDEADPPSGWETGGEKVQLLVPYDFGGNVERISDRGMSVLLEEIADKKGDNITVIMDCCHSGSITRERNSKHRIRCGHSSKPIPFDLDRNIWDNRKGGARSKAIPAEFLRSGLRSHVLLAACGRKEKAAEYEGRGYFTKALFDTLRATGADKVTYAEIIERVPCLPQQNPQCEGHNQGRILFNSKVSNRSKSWYEIWEEAGSYVMSAGAAHGIMDGEVFAVYKDQTSALTSSSLAEVQVSSIFPYSSKLVVISGDPRFGRGTAVKVRAGTAPDLSLYISTDEAAKKKLKCIIQAFESIANSQTGPRIVLMEEQMDLTISVKQDKIVVAVMDPLVKVHGISQMPHQIHPSIEDAQDFLRAAAHYHRYLRQSHKRDTEGFLDKIKIEFLKLEGGSKGQDRRPVGPNLNNGGLVELIVDSDTIYGVKVTNESSTPLYASLFFFETSDFSIDTYYEPGRSSGKVDPCLQPNGGSVTVGYGSGGRSPMQYVLEEGQNVDVGFLKLFLSDQYVDMSKIPQNTPFSQAGGKTRASREWVEFPDGLWVTSLVTVIQYRQGFGP